MLVARITGALVLAGLLRCGSAAAAEPSAEARRLYAEGKAEYAQGHYSEAVGLFERSYALSESPALLFNMAQAHRLAGPEHCSDAVSLYKSYLLAQPDAENEKEVRERIQELGDCSTARAPLVTKPPVAATPPATDTSTRSAAPPRVSFSSPTTARLPTGPVLATGTGAALLVAGGVLYFRAAEKHREAEKVCPCYPGTYSSWEVLTNVSYALLAVGGATLAGGVTWWLVGEPSGNGQPARAMFGVAGRF